MKTCFNDAEDAALQGLSPEAKLVYLLTIRRVMDFSTGLASVSYRACKQALEFIPEWGSTRQPVRVADISSHKIRSCLVELERNRLIKKVKNGHQKVQAAVFFVCLADRDEVCPKKEPRELHCNEPHEEHPQVSPKKHANSASCDNSTAPGTAQETHLNQQGNRTFPVKDITTTTTRAREPKKPATPLGWAQFFLENYHYGMQQVCDQRTMAMFAQWVDAQVPVSAVVEAVRRRGGGDGWFADSPRYYRDVVLDVMREPRDGGRSVKNSTGKRQVSDEARRQFDEKYQHLKIIKSE